MLNVSLPSVRRRNPTNRRSPITVCFMIDRLSRAGTETQLLALIRSLDRDRVQPVLCLLDGTDAESQALLPEYCPTLCLGVTSFKQPRTWTKALELRRFWQQHRVQVLQTYFLDSTYFAVPLARLCGRTRIIRVRNNAGYWLRGLHRPLGRLMGRWSSLTLTNSDEAAQALRQAENLPQRRLRVIGNGVDLERFPNPRPPMSGPLVRLGAVANLRPVKNLDGLIQSVKPLMDRWPNLVLEIAGDGEQRPMLEERIRNLGLSERVLLRGSIRDVPTFLSSVDVAVLCSHSESMSNALLEYMAAGRAIIATDVGANARLVRHEREGLIVPAGDEAALTTAIARYTQEPSLARQHAHAARQRVCDRYSRAMMVRQFEELYEELTREISR